MLEALTALLKCLRDRTHPLRLRTPQMASLPSVCAGGYNASQRGLAGAYRGGLFARAAAGYGHGWCNTAGGGFIPLAAAAGRPAR